MEFTLEQKLTRQVQKGGNPTACFFDIDGTIITLDWRIITSPFFNQQTEVLLKENNIPFILITGRFYWHWGRDLEVALEGFPQPDGIIYAGGTRIRLRTAGETYTDIPYLKDEKPLPSSLPNHSWKKLNPYLYATSVTRLPITQLQQKEKELQSLYGPAAKIFHSESLIRPNTSTVFSGSIYVGTKNANKEAAASYLLTYLTSQKKFSSLNAYLFGDGSIDIPMLTMKPPAKNLTLHQFLVHPTPLARLAAKTKNIPIIESEGPQAILKVIQNVIASAPPRSGKSAWWIARQSSYYSPAQNNPLRKIEKVFEPLLDTFIDSHLTANEVSLLGLEKVKRGVKLTQTNNFLTRVNGLGLVFLGNCIDILDGIRARGTKSHPTPQRIQNTPYKILNTNAIPGQLIDGFCDRAKEFAQLHARAIKRNGSGKAQTEQAALSCFLPSIARAHAELLGITVSERDSAGGSMLDRTKLLMLSLWQQVLGQEKKSYTIDEEILKRNLATFENRIHVIETNVQLPVMLNLFQHPTTEKLNQDQTKSLERFLLYVDLFQQAEKITDEKIDRQHDGEIIKFYLSLNIPKLRKQYGFKDYKLYL